MRQKFIILDELSSFDFVGYDPGTNRVEGGAVYSLEKRRTLG
jgi:hypothetical protein